MRARGQDQLGAGAMIYLRREPARDNTVNKTDIVAYDSPTTARAIARWPWHLSNRPHRGVKQVTVNNTRHPVVWLDYKGAPQ